MPVFFMQIVRTKGMNLNLFYLALLTFFLSLSLLYHNTCSICCPEYYPMAMTFLTISKRTDSSWFNMYESYKFFVKTLAREYLLSIPKIQVISDSTCAQKMLLSLFRFHVSLVSKKTKNKNKSKYMQYLSYFISIKFQPGNHTELHSILHPSTMFV